MATRRFSLFVGLLYVAWGICGFVPNLVRVPWAPVVARNTGLISDPQTQHAGGLLFGCLPVTPAKNVVTLLIGAAGVLAAAKVATARNYCRGLTAITGTMVVAGMLPFGVNTLWGLLPMSGGNLALHLITASAAFYFGWVYDFEPETEPDVVRA